MNEDLIKQLERTKFLIGELTNIQNLYYDTLVSELGIREEDEEFLFDYIYNGDEASFQEYLIKYNKDIDNVID